jgi:hypothetical protein
MHIAVEHRTAVRCEHGHQEQPRRHGSNQVCDTPAHGHSPHAFRICVHEATAQRRGH